MGSLFIKNLNSSEKNVKIQHFNNKIIIFPFPQDTFSMLMLKKNTIYYFLCSKLMARRKFFYALGLFSFFVPLKKEHSQKKIIKIIVLQQIMGAESLR